MRASNNRHTRRGRHLPNSNERRPYPSHYSSASPRVIAFLVPTPGLEGIQSGGGYVLAGIEVRFVCASPVTDECGSSQGYDFCVRNTIQELYEKDQTWQLLAAADAAQGPQQQGGGRSDKANTPLIAGLVAGETI